MNGIIIALLAGSAFLVSPDADKSDGVREVWAGSRELPTAIAYYEFTRLLAETRGTPHAHVHLLADAFGVSNVDTLEPAELDELRSQGELFVAHYTSMQLEVLETQMRILCTPSVARRDSYTAVRAAMNTADDISRPIQQKYLALGLARLPDEQRHAFRTFLDKFKESVTYKKVDNRLPRGIDEVPSGPGAILERACTDLQAQYAWVLQHGGL